MTTQDNTRTNANRQNFLRSESLRETAEQRMQADERAIREAEEAQLAGRQITMPNSYLNARARRVAAAEREGHLREAVLHTVAELVYAALPSDNESKAQYRAPVHVATESMLKECKDLLDFKHNAVAVRILEECSEVIDTVMAKEKGVRAAVMYECANGALGEILKEYGPVIETRVIQAVIASQNRAIDLEDKLTEAAAIDDEGARALREKAILASSKPSLIESLFSINTRNLNEAGIEADHDTVIAEAVSQYTMLETFNALGIMTIDAASAQALASNLMKR